MTAEELTQSSHAALALVCLVAPSHPFLLPVELVGLKTVHNPLWKAADSIGWEDPHGGDASSAKSQSDTI